MNDITTASPLAFVEPTVPDLRLAEGLGYKRPTNIRNLIVRHAPMLEAMGSLLRREAMIVAGKGAMRSVTEYHLNRAQAAFIIAKAGTKQADSLTVKMAEVFALFSLGGLVAVNEGAKAELAAIDERERARQRAVFEEDREARDSAFRVLASGRPYRKRRPPTNC